MRIGKQIEMVMRDMLFITWKVQPEVLRKLVHERLELDTKTDQEGRTSAFVSAVCFRVPEVRSSVLPLSRLSFEQVNYRAYVRADGVPAVHFFDMRVNSRMVTALTSFLKVPVAYEDIELLTNPDGAAAFRYAIASPGLRAQAIVHNERVSADDKFEISPDFITQRPVGYARAGDGMFKIEVDHPLLDVQPAQIENVKARNLEQIGLLGARESERPHSVFYVREALFGANTPARVW